MCYMCYSTHGHKHDLDHDTHDLCLNSGGQDGFEDGAKAISSKGKSRWVKQRQPKPTKRVRFATEVVEVRFATEVVDEDATEVKNQTQKLKDPLEGWQTTDLQRTWEWRRIWIDSKQRNEQSRSFDQ